MATYFNVQASVACLEDERIFDTCKSFLRQNE
jgi:hypothetical protein